MIKRKVLKTRSTFPVGDISSTLSSQNSEPVLRLIDFEERPRALILSEEKLTTTDNWAAMSFPKQLTRIKSAGSDESIMN